MKNSINTLSLLSACLVIGFLSACSSGSSSGGSTTSVAPTVQTSVGEIQGLERSYTPPAASTASLTSSAPYSVYEYRGIPYALAPTGERRWALPKPVASLGAGVFKAYEFGPACPQTARFNLTERSVNEDYLTINVSTPAGAKAGDNLPVLFWIHGGAFIGGSVIPPPLNLS
jgi:para-nitrobenzyl esterase